MTKESKIANAIFNAMFDIEELQEMEKKGAISCANGFKLSTIVTIELELSGNVKEWVNIKDKLPEYGDPVLLRINGIPQNVTWSRDGSDDSADWFEIHDPLNVYKGFKDSGFFIDFEKEVEWMEIG